MHQPARAVLRRQPALGETHTESWYLPTWIDHNHTVARAILGSCFSTRQLDCFFLSLSRLRGTGFMWPAMLVLFWHLRPCQLSVPLGPYCPWQTSLFGNRKANSALGLVGASPKITLFSVLVFRCCTVLSCIEMYACGKWALGTSYVVLLRCWNCHQLPSPDVLPLHA